MLDKANEHLEIIRRVVGIDDELSKDVDAKLARDPEPAFDLLDRATLIIFVKVLQAYRIDSDEQPLQPDFSPSGNRVTITVDRVNPTVSEIALINPSFLD